MDKGGRDVGPSARSTIVEEIINCAATARLLGLPIGTIYAMVSRKKIPHIRIGPRLVRFSRKALDEWLATRAVNPH
jgi:excisionase family DNA binding protein